MKRWKRLLTDPGWRWLALAWLLALALYLPTLSYGIIEYDDAWLVRDNWVVQTPSWASFRTIFFELDSAGRFTLAPEYLPIRDLSVMLDFAIWGKRYAGFHLTNILLYLGLIGVWFAVFVEFGISRAVAGLALLFFALHPVHAESVAWLAERKGLLGMTLAGLASFGYARFRAGASARWLALATLAGVCAVWSKAHAAFALAALAGLELIWPERRSSWRRVALGLGSVGVTSLLAFVPVVWLASGSDVVGDEMRAPAGRFAMALGTQGFYLRLAAASLKNAVSYPISSIGPSTLELVLGVTWSLVLLALLLVPGDRAVTFRRELRGAAWLWLAGWLPVSHLLLPLQMIFVADRYLVLPSLGFSLGLAALVNQLPAPRWRAFVLAVVVTFGLTRSLEARNAWSSGARLWARAVESNPRDGEAWSMYAEALLEGANPDLAAEVVEEGLRHSRHPRLILRQALLRLAAGDAIGGRAAMREAALGGEPRAMSNYALLALEDGRIAEALEWARRGATTMAMYAPAQRALGRVALRAQLFDEALVAFTRAFELDPAACTNRFNLALVELELQHLDASEVHVSPCTNDAALGHQARALLREIARRRALTSRAP